MYNLEIETKRNNMVVVLDKREGKRSMFSYDTLIATFDGDTFELVEDKWNISQTTLKHLYTFISNYVYCTPVMGVVDKRNKQAEIIRLIEEDLICLI